MKKLSKDELKIKSDLENDFHQKSKVINELWGAYEDAVNALNEAIADLNGTVTDMNTFKDEIVQQMDDYFDEKSEKWQEGDTGSAYSEWKGEWEQLSIDQMEEIALGDNTLPDIEEFEQVATEFNI